MKKFQNTLLVSDFDGTLINHQSEISAENIAAIRFFIQEGGRFCGATGRTELSVRAYIGDLPLDLPWILYNGAAIYDWQKKDFLYRAYLNRALAQNFVHKVILHLPKVSIQIFAGGPFYEVNPAAPKDTEILKENHAFRTSTPEDISDDWFKILFCSDSPDALNTIALLLKDDPLNADAHSMRSDARYFEITKKGVNKGSALQKLKKILMLPEPLRVIAIGDYHNDLEMIQMADIGAAPESAHKDVRAVAQIITKSHENHAIADLISKL